MRQTLRFIRVTCIICIALVGTMPVFGHGVRINHSIDSASGEITVVAAFDTGAPLAEGQVIIFAPNDLINPWLTDVLDDEGTFTFLPDYSIEGFWDVQVRQAGHGGLINIEITASMAPQEADADEAPDETTQAATTLTMNGDTPITISGDAQFQVEGDIVISATGNIVEAQAQTTSSSSSLTEGFTTGQIAIMSVSVIWGFIGTALYFSRRRNK